MTNLRMEDFQACIVCGRQGSPLYKDMPDRLFGVEGSFSFCQCKSCKLLWLNPRPAREDIPKCYKEYYTHGHEEQLTRREESTRPLGSLRDFLRNIILCGHLGYRHVHTNHTWCFLGPLLSKIPFLMHRAVYDLRERFPRYKGPEALLVDIGCGEGGYLQKMKDMGWNVLGIEPDAVSAGRAENNGIRVLHGTIETVKLPDASADHITMNHVIEHLADPLVALNECHRILKKGGKLVLYTPNSVSLAHALFGSNLFSLDPPRHLFVFSPKSMAKLLKKTAFSRFSVTTSPYSAKGMYDCSMSIAKQGKIDFFNVPHLRGRYLFSFTESLLCLFGFSAGEEIQVVAVKE